MQNHTYKSVACNLLSTKKVPSITSSDMRVEKSMQAKSAPASLWNEKANRNTDTRRKHSLMSILHGIGRVLLTIIMLPFYGLFKLLGFVTLLFRWLVTHLVELILGKLFAGLDKSLLSGTRSMMKRELSRQSPEFFVMLRNLGASDKQWTLPITDEVLIGRSPEANLTLDDKTVSRKQFRIFVHNGHLAVENLSRTNKTNLNGILLVERMPLRPGDVLSFGRVSLRVEYVRTSDYSSATRSAWFDDIDVGTQLPDSGVYDEDLIKDFTENVNDSVSTDIESSSSDVLFDTETSKRTKNILESRNESHYHLPYDQRESYGIYPSIDDLASRRRRVEESSQPDSVLLFKLTVQNQEVFARSIDLKKLNDELIAKAVYIAETTKSFPQLAWHHIERCNCHYKETFRERTLLSDKTFDRIKSGELINPTLDTVMAVCIGLNLGTTFGEPLLKSAGYDIASSTQPLHLVYYLLLSVFQGRTIFECNKVLETYSLPLICAKAYKEMAAK